MFIIEKVWHTTFFRKPLSVFSWLFQVAICAVCVSWQAGILTFAGCISWQFLAVWFLRL